LKALAYMPKSKNQEHQTPDRIFDLILRNWRIPKRYFYDPCPVGTPFRAPCFFNGLYGDWKNYNFVNPPFEIRTLEKFVSKALDEIEKDHITIMLLPAKTDQAWFHDMILEFDFEILWIRKRLKFKNNKDSSTGSHFLVKINS